MLAWKSVLLGHWSPSASSDNTCERGELVQVQEVDGLEPCSILWLWSATNFQILPAFEAGSSCEFPSFVFDVLLIFWFHTIVFLHRVATVRLFPSVSTTFVIFPFFPEMIFCNVVLLAFLICWTMSPLATANR